MWMWRRRSHFEKLVLPRRVFISHSYKDAKERERLLTLLPKHVEPFIFPPIVVPPEQMISDDLIEAMLACDGLIYLTGGHSAESFWVAFERDYALRAGKNVFAYEPDTRSLRRDESAPLHLPIFVSYRGSSEEQKEVRIVGFLRAQRHFDPWLDVEHLHPGVSFLDEINAGIIETIDTGGCLVVFLSDLQYRDSLGLEITGSDPGYHVRGTNLVFVNKDALDPPRDGVVGNTALPGDLSSIQKLDGLIVTLYWLIYRNTQQNQLS